MKERDFFYWLQGAYEIVGVTAVSVHNIDIIENHANLVKETLRLQGEEPSIAFLAICDLISQHKAAPDRRDCARISVQMQKTLSHQFEHVIDPSFGGQDVQDQLNAVHAGGFQPMKGKDGEVYRC